MLRNGTSLTNGPDDRIGAAPIGMRLIALATSNRAG
jgi:hypothetical protein